MMSKTKHLNIILFLLIKQSTWTGFKITPFLWLLLYHFLFYMGSIRKSWYFKVRFQSWGYDSRLRVGTEILTKCVKSIKTKIHKVSRPSCKGFLSYFRKYRIGDGFRPLSQGLWFCSVKSWNYNSNKNNM